MEVQCPNCHRTLSIPKDREGEKIRCAYCREVLIAIDFKPGKTVVPLDKISKNISNQKPKIDFLFKLWNGIPKPFKITFFGTFGIISALILCLYAYSYLFMPIIQKKSYNNIENNIENKSNPLYVNDNIEEDNSIDYDNKYDYQSIKEQLIKNELFPDISGPKNEILRGRFLLTYTFFPDATDTDYFLKIYYDEDNKLTALSAQWVADSSGFFPLDLDYKNGSNNSIFDNDNIIILRAIRILSSFNDISDFNPIIPNFRYKRNPNEFWDENNNWKFEIHRMDSGIKAKKEYIKKCKKENIDPNIYIYLSIGRNW